jgi:hypothetical protein
MRGALPTFPHMFFCHGPIMQEDRPTCSCLETYPVFIFN